MEQVADPPIGQKEYLDLLCYANPKFNILALRQTVGDRTFLAIMERFAGLYIRFPAAHQSSKLANEVKLALLWQDVRSKSRKDAVAWQEAEGRFIKMANRLGYSYDRAVRRAKVTLKELSATKAWLTDLRHFEQRHRKDPE